MVGRDGPDVRVPGDRPESPLPGWARPVQRGLLAKLTEQMMIPALLEGGQIHQVNGEATGH